MCIVYPKGILHHIRDTGTGIGVKLTPTGGEKEKLYILTTYEMMHKQENNLICMYIAVLVCEELWMEMRLRQAILMKIIYFNIH